MPTISRIAAAVAVLVNGLRNGTVLRLTPSERLAKTARRPWPDPARG